jgi:hypothetical protein
MSIRSSLLKAASDRLREKRGPRGVKETLKSIKETAVVTPFSMDKKDALADLGYGNRKNVEKEIAAANKYRRQSGMQRLNVGSGRDNVQVEYGDGTYTFYPDDLDRVGSITTPESDIRQDDSKMNQEVNAFLKGDVTTPEGTIGHELTHDLTHKDTPKIYQIGRAKKFSSDTDKNKVYDKYAPTYPELTPREFAPPLAALTRHEYKTTGKRITNSNQFNKKVEDYLSKSDEEKLVFRKSLPSEVSRFYGYVDKVSSPDAKDIKVWGAYNAKLMKKRFPKQNLQPEVEREGEGGVIKGKDRFKRFMDISRDMIPALVKKQESVDKLLKRRRA